MAIEVPGEEIDEASGRLRAGKTPVVGIGASAGGLSALRALFEALPDDTGLAFVVVVHLDPSRESVLYEIVQKHTRMPVQQVTERVKVEPNSVYVIPPAQRIVITDSHLKTEPFDEPRGHRRPIDDFFRSLAAVHRDAVAIILSGSGTDGAVGVKAIKETGGLIFVQAPYEAEFDSMPRAAIDTGLADAIASVSEIATTLVAVQSGQIQLPHEGAALTGRDEDLVQHILAQVQARTGHDFSQYKSSTLLRRIHRRMQLQGQPTLEDYLLFLRHTPEEPRALFNDLLIGVTNFFRDREAWEALAWQAIPHLFEGKGAGDSVRVWTIGCSTGEEAYTVAMLLLEHLSTLDPATSDLIDVQVFASDLDETSLTKAREGLYPAAIEADVSPERLERFFIREGDHYRIRRELRDLVLFAQHSILRDPPFSRLDLISCRNLLIYLRRPLQEMVFDMFHYALNLGGYLFLGNAESIETVSEHFRVVDKTHRVYQAIPRRGEPHLLSLPLSMRRLVPGSGRVPQPYPGTQPHSAPPAVAELHRVLLEEESPPSALVDESYQILHLSESAGRYFRLPGGSPTNDLLKLVRPELQADLHGALFEAFEKNCAVVTGAVPVWFNGNPHRVTMTVRPRQRPDHRESRLALVFFLEDELEEPLPTVGEEGSTRSSGIETVGPLQAEVRRLRERLQAITEQYEASAEELKAANEELQSINEEYRSTTEELETSKEELQSVNEELQTVNNELKHKLEEVSRAHSDLENLMTATQIATLFLDRELRIQRYTPHLQELFHIMAGDRGRPISHLTRNLDYPALEEDAQRVLRTLVPAEREVRGRDGGWYLVRVRPYRTVDHRIDGVVLTFVDITGRKEVEEALREAQQSLEIALEAARLGTWAVDLRTGQAHTSVRHNQIFGYTEPVEWWWPERFAEVILPEDRPIFEERLAQALKSGELNLEARVRWPDGSIHWIHDLGRVYYDEAGTPSMMAGVTVDITERKHTEEVMRELNETLEARVVERTRQVEELALALTLAEQAERQRVAQILHDDLQQRLYSLLMRLQLLFRAEQGVPQAEELMAQLTDAIRLTRTLVTELNPPVLENEGLPAALQWLADHMQAMYGLEVHLEVRHPCEPRSSAMRTLLIQMARELLFNVVKHAEVREAWMVLEQIGSTLQLHIVDYGVGFDVTQLNEPAVGPGGVGLRSISERLKLMGGRVEIHAARGEGSQMTLYAPCR